MSITRFTRQFLRNIIEKEKENALPRYTQVYTREPKQQKLDKFFQQNIAKVDQSEVNIIENPAESVAIPK